MATSPLGLADEMYSLLPLIYHRYDTLPPRAPATDIDAADLTLGALRRFLDLPGGQLDQMYSFARALLDSADLHRVEGSLLPLLAQWIGWNTDYSLELGAQRNQIRNAPRLYRSIGIIPVVEATVKRISSRESRDEGVRPQRRRHESSRAAEPVATRADGRELGPGRSSSPWTRRSTAAPPPCAARAHSGSSTTRRRKAARASGRRHWSPRAGARAGRSSGTSGR